MNMPSPPNAQKPLWAAALTILLVCSNTPARSAPGAHGPNGEHLDAPTMVRHASTSPHVEAKSDLFELVATLGGGNLSVVVDRYETNEPVLNAALEVESGDIKAKATFRADHGDYVFNDPKLLALLGSPGEYGLVFTLIAGGDTDLLDGTLVVSADRLAAAKDDHGHAHGDGDHGHGHDLERAAWIGAGVATLGLISGIAWWRQRRRVANKLQGGL